MVHAWLRSGNTASARGVKAFLAETLARLPADFRLYALRADSGFFVTEFLVELERRALPYAIAVRMNPHLRRTVAGIKQWTPFARGLEAAETNYQAYGWQAPAPAGGGARNHPRTARGARAQTARGPRLYLPRLSHHPQA